MLAKRDHEAVSILAQTIWAAYQGFTEEYCRRDQPVLMVWTGVLLGLVPLLQAARRSGVSKEQLETEFRAALSWVLAKLD